MKKTLIALLMVLLCAMLIISCSNEPKVYEVTFDLNGGSGTVEAQSVEEGSKATKPTDPTRNGFSFLGWYADNTKFEFETTEIKADITLKAKWGVTVTFNTDGGSDIASVVVEENKTLTKPTNPTKTGLIFNYWTKDGTTEFNLSTPLTESITLKATWRDYEAGDIVTYGTYPNNYAIEGLKTKAITWRILSVDKTNSRMLVISENVLDPSRSELDFESYSGSDIQKYLNGDFIKTYGLGNVSIVNVNATAEDITFGSGTDKVFLLSKTEAENTSYFASPAARVANYNGGARQWNLRSVCSGSFKSPYAVMPDGTIQGYSHAALRPAMWVSL